MTGQQHCSGTDIVAYLLLIAILGAVCVTQNKIDNMRNELRACDGTGSDTDTDTDHDPSSKEPQP